MNGNTPQSRLFSIIALLAATLLTISPTHAEDCDRACLEGLMDQFLTALEARDASALPLTADIRYTENGQTMALNDGLWKTFSKNSTYRLHVSDPVAGQIAFLGVIGENEERIIAHFRMQVVDQKIAEVEALLARNTRMSKLENLQEPRPIFLETLPPEQRSGRKEMVAITDSYFTGLDTEESGANVPFDENCQRQENGMILANSPDPEASPMQKLGCKAQFDTGFSTIVTDVRERRFMVLDEERGLSYAIIFFDHNGTPKTMGTVGGAQVEVRSPYNRPSTIMIGELFKIVNGKIRQIEAIIVSVPYGMPSGWNGVDLVSLGQL